MFAVIESGGKQYRVEPGDVLEVELMGSVAADAEKGSAVRFERVLGAQVQAIDLKNKSLVLSLLAVTFEPTVAPEGYVTLHFADGGAIRLHVECVEAELKDLGPIWQVEFKPQHPDGSPISAAPGKDPST